MIDGHNFIWVGWAWILSQEEIEKIGSEPLSRAAKPPAEPGLPLDGGGETTE